MPLVGLLIGHHVASSMGSAAQYLGGGLLMATGIFTVVQARRVLTTGAVELFQWGRLVVIGAALSIDNLVIGFALGAYKVPVFLAASVIAAVSVGMSLVGLEVGSRFGSSVEKWSSEIGGLVLIFVGIVIAAGAF
jgi:putative Mn2+ efflux pump MntP